MDDHFVDALHVAVYHLIQRFVQRQRLPFEVIQKFRPHLLDPTIPRPSKEYASATQLGHWGQNDEWDYFLHGVGCRLTHTSSGEVIDWDAPDLNRFDRYWLVGWLTWFLEQTAQEEAASTILRLMDVPSEAFQTQIFDVLEDLCQSGKLRHYPDSQNRYELIA